jgi:hypothetical protein
MRPTGMLNPRNHCHNAQRPIPALPIAGVVSDILDNLGHREHVLDPAIRPIGRGKVIAGLPTHS